MHKICFLSFFILMLINSALSIQVPDSVSTDINLRTYIEKEEVPLNREVVYHIELSWLGELNKYKINEVLEPVVSNLTTRGSGSSNKVTVDAAGRTHSIKRITFYFIPMARGMSYIDGVTIRYETPETQQDESLISSRIGVKIIDPLPEPGDYGWLSTAALAFVCFCVIAFTVYFYLQYRKRKIEEQKNALLDLKESTEEKYSRLMKETIHFNTDNIKDSLSDLSHLLNGYLAERYNLPAATLSIDNLLEALETKDIPTESFGRIKEFYTAANLIKFAGENASEADFHRLYDTVELVLENLKTGHIAEEDK